jgi:heme/copper-type cytochrome/quinol oxidase subunit 2
VGRERVLRHGAPARRTLNIYAVGKQWMWKFQHLDGQREINELHVPVGRAVKMIMTSEDVIHDFFVPAFASKPTCCRDATPPSGSSRPSRGAITCSAPSIAAPSTRA